MHQRNGIRGVYGDTLRATQPLMPPAEGQLNSFSRLPMQWRQNIHRFLSESPRMMARFSYLNFEGA